MRITNKIMQNNSLNNINMNKVLEDKLNTQMSTKKKITKPSDDPVIAIRALRLRGNVTEVTQYYKKNIPDANSWLEVTEGALKKTSDIITNMIGQVTKGANGDQPFDVREIILEQLKALRNEVYSTADVDNAGRYVFAGYRTDTSISFIAAEKKEYTITEQLDTSAMDDVTYIKTTATNAAGDTVDINDINSTNYNNIDVSENDITSSTVHRIRLSYDNLSDGMVPALTRVTGKDADGNITTEEIVPAANVETVSYHASPSAYELVAQNPDKVYFIPETGEMLLGDNVYRTMSAYKDDATTATVNEGEIRITYQKNEWLKGDLRPEHYFACTSTDDNGVTTDYNQEYLDGSDVEKQVIEYDVGFNQTIRVNTTADEVFKPGIGRETDDLVRALEDVQSLEKVVGNLDTMVKSETDETKKATLQKRLDAANKALTLSKDKMQKMFESGLTAMQGYLDANNLAITQCGTRGSKLELIENRMKDQKTTFETLQSENEDIDIEEATIQMKGAQLTYTASLMAASKILQTNLLSYL